MINNSACILAIFALLAAPLSSNPTLRADAEGRVTTDCGGSDDYKEVIPWWPDRDWHVGSGSSLPFPDDWQPDGEFIYLNTWNVHYPHASWEGGWSAAHHDEC